MLLHADAVTDGQRVMLRINRRTGIALLIGIIPIRLIPEKFQVNLSGLQFGLLQAEEIGVQVREHIREPLPCHGPQAVYVP